MIKAVIFDMDGLLINSEPFWQGIESTLFSNITNQQITIEMTKQTMGMRVDEVVDYWYQKYPWQSPTKKEVEATIIDGVIQKVQEEGKEMPGVSSLIKQFRQRNIPMAIASSSYPEIITAVVEKLALQPYMDYLHSAQHEPYGKPHPGVYITTAEKLNVSPKDCLVFEDSPNGVIAAKAAQMTCIAVPDHAMKDDKRFTIADTLIHSLEDFSFDDII